MPAITYPSTLPGPSLSVFTPKDRLRSSTLPGLPQVAPRERDLLGVEELSFTMTPEETEAFDAWWRAILYNGGLRFAAAWPLPQGFDAVRVRKFTSPPQWRHRFNGNWTFSISAAVYGRAELPQLNYAVETTQSGTAETAHSFALPQGEIGDLLVVCYSFDRQAATTVELDTAASGNNWTDTRLAADGARGYGGVAWKIAEGDDVLQFTTSVGEQSLAAAYRLPLGLSAYVTSVNNGPTLAPNPPANTPPTGEDDYLWIAFAVATVLDDTPANQVTFTAWPSGYDEELTLTGEPNNPSLATAVKRATASSENPGAFAIDRSETALSFTIAVRF